MPITIFFNDEPISLDNVMSLNQFLLSLRMGMDGIAIALNGTVVPRNRWDEVPLASNDQILLITATQGG